MRLVICAVVVAALPTVAVAADLDVLRGSEQIGSPTYTNWSGFYAGGQIGEDFNGIDFSKVAGPDVATISTLSAGFDGIPLGSFTELSKMNTTKATWGAFIGYNFQFEDAVIGFEINYSKATLRASAQDSGSHSYFQQANGTLYDATYNVNVAAAAAISNYATVRSRFGWAFQNFLPYAFAGISVAQINASSSVNVNYCGEISPYSCANPPPPSNPPPPAPIGGSWTISHESNGRIHYGYDFGLGLDYRIVQNLFLRGEAEYIEFGSPNATRLSAESIRLGAGIKF